MQMVEYLNLAKQPKKWSGKEGCAPLLSLTLNLVAWATDTRQDSQQPSPGCYMPFTLYYTLLY